MTNIFTTFYTEQNPLRAAELLHCIRLNLNEDSIDRLYVIEEPPWCLGSLLTHAKIVLIPVPSRPTFSDIFEIVRNKSSKADINVILNTDIHFPKDSVFQCKTALAADECFALSRWDISVTARTAHLNWSHVSQDAWVFRGHPRNVDGRFFMGKLGCDQRLAWELRRAGYKVKNPSREVRAFHLHESNIRNYSSNASDSVLGEYAAVHNESLTRRKSLLWTAQRVLRRALRPFGLTLRAPYVIAINKDEYLPPVQR